MADHAERGRARLGEGAWAEALEAYEAALGEVADEDPVRGELTWGRARALRGLGRLEEALELQLALARANEARGQANGRVAEELGELYLALERVDEAKPWLAKAWVLLSSDRVIVQEEQERLARLHRLAGLGF